MPQLHTGSHTGRSGVDTRNSNLGQNERYEHCESCDGECIHNISIEFTTNDTDNTKTHGKAPFRVARCLTCKTETKQRVGSMSQSETA